MKKYLLSVSAWVLLTTSASFAQQTTAPQPPSTKDDILRLFDTMQIRQQMRLVMESVAQQMKDMTHETLKKRDATITDEQLARFDAIAQESMKDFPVDAMLDDMIPVYQKHLSKPDVDTMIVFYSSSTGQKLLREMPAMTQEGMQAAYGRMQKQMDATMQRIEQMVKEEQPKPKRKPAPPPTTSRSPPKT
jgi:hypothetical protein